MTPSSDPKKKIPRKQSDWLIYLFNQSEFLKGHNVMLKIFFLGSGQGSVYD